MRSVLARIRNLCRFAKITGAADNGTQFPVQQIVYKGVTSDSLIVFPYGMYANVSTDSLALMFSVDADSANKAAIAYTPQERPDDLDQNEVAFYHPKINSFIKIRNSGHVEIESAGELNVTIVGNVNITTTGDVNVEAENVNIDATVTNLGVGGQPIARVGDSVECVVGSGSSTGTWPGTITTGGDNTSI